MTWKPVKEEEIKKFQEAFLKAKQKKRVTLRQIAKDKEISLTHLSNYNSGKTIPRAKNHKKLEEYFGTTLPFYG